MSDRQIADAKVSRGDGEVSGRIPGGGEKDGDAKRKEPKEVAPTGKMPVALQGREIETIGEGGGEKDAGHGESELADGGGEILTPAKEKGGDQERVAEEVKGDKLLNDG